MDDFPYKRAKYTDEQIREMFRKLEKYNMKTRLREIKDGYTIKNLPEIPREQLQFLGNAIILENFPTDYTDFNILSDMFQEPCRMQCAVLGRESPLDFYKQNRQRIEEFAKKRGIDMREAVYQMTKECSSHRPTNIMAMIQLFGAKRIIDFSAGWGDRLLGAMASDGNIEKYIGIDPNPCVHRGYKEMIKFFGKYPQKFIMIESPAETADLSPFAGRGEFDLIYTSPPYFDLETYIKKNANTNAKQSISRYKTEDKWFNEFLMPVVKKMWEYLRKGGILAININQKRGEHYIQWMLEKVGKIEGANYLGVISYGLDAPQPIWIWKRGVGV
jgi:hypothetical protein